MTDPRLIPELICSEIDRSLEFYTQVLGFTVLYARPDERFACLDREGARLMLEQPVGRRFLAAPLVAPYGRGMNLQIEVSDVRSLYEAARASGPRIYLPREEKWYRRDGALAGSSQFIVRDPDGYLLRFFQDLGTRPLE